MVSDEIFANSGTRVFVTESYVKDATPNSHGGIAGFITHTEFCRGKEYTSVKKDENPNDPPEIGAFVTHTEFFRGKEYENLMLVSQRSHIRGRRQRYDYPIMFNRD